MLLIHADASPNPGLPHEATSATVSGVIMVAAANGRESIETFQVSGNIIREVVNVVPSGPDHMFHLNRIQAWSGCLSRLLVVSCGTQQ